MNAPSLLCLRAGDKREYFEAAADVMACRNPRLKPLCNMTVWEATIGTETLTVICIGVALTLPVIVGYTILMYRVFWGKARNLTYDQECSSHHGCDISKAAFASKKGVSPQKNCE